MSKDYKGIIHCLAPFSSAVIMQTNQLKPCCEWQFTHPIQLVDDRTLEDQLDSFSNLRQDFLKANNNVKKVRNCITCARASKQYLMHNKHAKTDIDYIETPTLTNLHLKFNNFCNLACRMCDSDSSSIIAKERNEKFNNSKNPFIQKVLTPGTTLYNSIFESMKNINHLWFSGGEPLIQKEVWHIIEYCVKNNYAKNIEIKFNTNGTVKLTKQQLDLIKKYKTVHFDISMDGTGELAEYIRTKVKWNDWIQNFKKYKELTVNNSQIKVNIATALSVYNVHKIDEIYNFFHNTNNVDISFTPVWYPNELCVANLNSTAKNFLREKYANNSDKKSFIEVIKLLKITSDKNTDIKKYIDSQDESAIKSNMYKKYKKYYEVEPEWYKLI